MRPRGPGSLQARWYVPAVSEQLPAAPELVLLFKAEHRRPKDQADFDATVPYLTPAQRGTLTGLLSRVHPGHVWLAEL